MDIVHTIRRIDVLDRAAIRAYQYANRHADDIAIDIDFRLEDDARAQRSRLQGWMRETGITAHERTIRHTQVKTACRLLHVEIDNILY